FRPSARTYLPIRVPRGSKSMHGREIRCSRSFPRSPLPSGMSGSGWMRSPGEPLRLLSAQPRENSPAAACRRLEPEGSVQAGGPVAAGSRLVVSAETGVDDGGSGVALVEYIVDAGKGIQAPILQRPDIAGVQGCREVRRRRFIVAVVDIHFSEITAFYAGLPAAWRRPVQRSERRLPGDSGDLVAGRDHAVGGVETIPVARVEPGVGQRAAQMPRKL